MKIKSNRNFIVLGSIILGGLVVWCVHQGQINGKEYQVSQNGCAQGVVFENGWCEESSDFIFYKLDRRAGVYKSVSHLKQYTGTKSFDQVSYGSWKYENEDKILMNYESEDPTSANLTYDTLTISSKDGSTTVGSRK